MPAIPEQNYPWTSLGLPEEEGGRVPGNTEVRTAGIHRIPHEGSAAPCTVVQRASVFHPFSHIGKEDT